MPAFGDVLATEHIKSFAEWIYCPPATDARRGEAEMLVRHPGGRYVFFGPRVHVIDKQSWHQD